mmetsp:Transcript_42741/g.65661  ORF Transcript_42741/g.65661 Transcript_42741/m.65661 type:complete len:97 (+) Transcript_42741:3314-3604(+)
MRSSLDNIKAAEPATDRTFSIKEDIKEDIQVNDNPMPDRVDYTEDTLDREEETIYEEIEEAESPPGNRQSTIYEEIPVESDFNLTIGPIQTITPYD